MPIDKLAVTSTMGTSELLLGGSAMHHENTAPSVNATRMYEAFGYRYEHFRDADNMPDCTCTPFTLSNLTIAGLYEALAEVWKEMTPPEERGDSYVVVEFSGVREILVCSAAPVDLIRIKGTATWRAFEKAQEEKQAALKEAGEQIAAQVEAAERKELARLMAKYR